MKWINHVVVYVYINAKTPVTPPCRHHGVKSRHSIWSYSAVIGGHFIYFLKLELNIFCSVYEVNRK